MLPGRALLTSRRISEFEALRSCGKADHPFANESDQAAFAAAVRFPEFLVRNVAHQIPDVRIVVLLAPVRLKVLVVEQRQIAIEIAGQMYAVGNRSDRHFVGRQIRPEVLPHLLRHFAMQRADGIAIRRRSRNARIAIEKRSLLIAGISAAEREQLIESDSRALTVVVEVLVHQAGVEEVDSRRNRGVCREDVVVPARFESFFESQPCSCISERIRSTARKAECPSFM